MPDHPPKTRPSQPAIAVVALLAIHAALLGYSATLHSPSIDEVGHMAAGLVHWSTGRFELYRVNPPLARLVATAPVALQRPMGLKSDLFRSGARPEFDAGQAFISANGALSFRYFAIARLICIPFSLLGALVCYRWARECYGVTGGLIAIVLWCVCPNIVAHAQMITPDVPAAALGASAYYLFWRWLRKPSWERAYTTGIVLGIAELTKTTFVIFYAVLPAAWLLWRVTVRSDRVGQARQLALIAGLSMCILNIGYAFEGAFQPLGDYHFISRALGGRPDMAGRDANVRNRFAKTSLAGLRVPLPSNYLLGIDAQRFDFEHGYDSYLRGEWRHGGWWYYYLYGLAVKVPLGTWLLFFMALAAGWSSARASRRPVRDGRHADARDDAYATQSRASKVGGQWPPYATWRDEFVLLLPAVAILALVSSQTGFNHHLRYVLPIFPFMLIWIGRLGRVIDRGGDRRGMAPNAAHGTPQRALPTDGGTARSPISAGGRRRSLPMRRWAVYGALAWTIASSLWYYPHSLSYFNELAGGPLGGPRHLLDSNIDWGQDVLLLKRWLDAHPEARPLGFAYFGLFDPRAAAIEFALPPLGPSDAEDAPGRRTSEMGPKPGWYALSLMMIHGYKFSIPDGDGGTFYTDQPYFTYFQHFRPVARAGYSIYIYHIDLGEANRVRRLLGLAPLTEGEASDDDLAGE